MGSKINCPSCNMRLNLGQEMAGQTIQCPGCKAAIHIESTLGVTMSTPPVPPEQPPQPGQAPDLYPPTNPAYPTNKPYEPAAPYPPAYGNANPPPQSFHPPAQRGGGNSVGCIVGCLGGGCLLIVVIAILIALLLPAVQAVREEARRVAGDGQGQNLLEAREGHNTNLNREQRDGTPAPKAPRNLFDTIKYQSEVGPLTAYVGKDPGDGQKHPAMIWLFGGFSNGIGEGAWVRQNKDNDQSASIYREMGMVMMYPSFRGGNDNPGHQECMWGEINDVLAAADYLASLPYVDPEQIYLGGHSTGGTLALLCTAATDRFAGTVSLGPVDDVSGYGQDMLPFNAFNRNELEFRNPINWIASIKTPTVIIEGQRGNASSVNALHERARYNSKVNCHVIPNLDHFSVIAPANRILAEKIKNRNGAANPLELDSDELQRIR